MTQYWLLKSEPTTFSIDDLAASPKKTTCWEGVRNYQARNFLKSMQVGDQGFFYHSNADPNAIVGRVEVVKAAYSDPYAFDAHSRYFDPKSTRENPRWVVVDVRFLEKFREPLSLAQLRTVKALQHMELLRKGSRLSVQPVSHAEWQCILKLTATGTNSAG